MLHGNPPVRVKTQLRIYLGRSAVGDDYGARLTVRVWIASASRSGSCPALTRRDAQFRRLWPILHESANVVRLTAPVGENDRNVRYGNRENGRYRCEPPEVVQEQEDRDTKADGAERHHDQVPALPVGDVFGHWAPSLRHHVNVLVAVPPCDPHTSKVSSPSADRHSGRRRRPLRFERSRCAGPGGDPPDPRCAGPGGDPPEPPACAPRPVVVLRRHTGHSPGPRPGVAGPVTIASP